jgi:hypothetical protein
VGIAACGARDNGVLPPEDERPPEYYRPDTSHVTEEEMEQYRAKEEEKKKNREEREERFYSSNAYNTAMDYLLDIFSEYMPGADRQEMKDCIDMTNTYGHWGDHEWTDEEYDTTVNDTETAKTFFSKTKLSIYNLRYWEYGASGEVLSNDLMQRGVTGYMDGAGYDITGETGEHDAWNFDASEGKVYPEDNAGY